MRHLTLCCLFLLAVLSSQISFAKDSWKNVDRIVAIGDIHGDYEQYRRVMKMTGLIDENGDWAAGKTHFVQLGDIPDRGAGTLQIMRELNELKRQARKAKGYVHLLIGNHEAMNVYGDLRYVHPGEYGALVTDASPQKQEDYFIRFIDHMRKTQPDLTVDDAFRENWNKRFPLGYVEHRYLWAKGGESFDKVQNQNVAIRINNILFVHAGLNPHEPPMPLREINKRIRKELTQNPLPDGTLAENEQGPLWYRGYSTNPASEERVPLEKMLASYGANHIVVGHRPTRGFIHPRFDRRAIMIDVGLSAHYGSGMAALLIENGEFFALHRGVKLPLPDDEGLLSYFEQLQEIEPDSKAIARVLRILRGQPNEAVPVESGG